jgi:hypothetical protein
LWLGRAPNVGFHSAKREVDLATDRLGILEWPRFYALEVNGEKLVDSVRRLIEGKPVDDVHCQKCRVG